MRRLNRILGTTAAIVALVGLPVAAGAGMGGTEHDFSGAGWNSASGEICIVCHVPHNGDITLSAPLWNHQVTAVDNYTIYASGTLQGTIGQPGDVSLLCLSCHDGTVAVDAFGASPTSTFTLVASDPGYVGEDLSDDHPIGILYDAALSVTDPGLYDPTTTDAAIVERPGPITSAMLFSEQVECASCHDPHQTGGFEPFLRKSNASSALCTTCHNK